MAYHYIAAGVRADCKVLIEKFIKKNSVRFQDFLQIWKEMHFPCIYSGRPSFAELYEFVEEVLLIAKEFFLPPNNLQTRICGLYLLYGLYYMQPTIEEPRNFEGEGDTPKSDVLRLEESGLLNSLEEVSKKYYAFKCRLIKGNNEASDSLPPSLNYVSQNVAEMLRKTMNPLSQGYKEDTNEAFDIGNLRRKLRKKASQFNAAEPSTSK
ncbi:hypothetical protein C0J52_04179 [Blattella germanica]|nr:hypothetical protein C0J52_04179 [Blattella germanica]